MASLALSLDLVLEPGRGNDRAEFAGRINHDCYLGSAGHGFAVNPRDKGRSLCPLLADANLGGVARYTQIADIELF